MKERNDDYQTRREHLKGMSDKELKNYFFNLTEDIVKPLFDMGKHYTSKSIERSVLLRMGFSSIECKDIVDVLYENHLLSKGAGHCVYRVAKDKSLDFRDAGMALAQGEHIVYLREVFDIHEES
ncbi:MAG: ornithine aminomutase subunit alpha [Bacillota bacterium]